MKKVLAAVLIGLAVGSAVFAAEDGKMEMYAKATIGYGGAGVNFKNYHPDIPLAGFGQSVYGFEITPAFGFGMPFSVDQNWGAIKFAVEVQVPIVLGSANIYGKNFAFMLKPGAMFMAGYYFPSDFPEWLQKLSPHMGTGFSIPIATSSWNGGSDSGAGFSVDILTGVQYDFNEHISAVVDWNQAIGTGYGTSIRLGGIWRF